MTKDENQLEISAPDSQEVRRLRAYTVADLRSLTSFCDRAYRTSCAMVYVAVLSALLRPQYQGTGCLVPRNTESLRCDSELRHERFCASRPVERHPIGTITRGQNGRNVNPSTGEFENAWSHASIPPHLCDSHVLYCVMKAFSREDISALWVVTGTDHCALQL
jgi:hypothetical protein